MNNRILAEERLRCWEEIFSESPYYVEAHIGHLQSRIERLHRWLRHERETSRKMAAMRLNGAKLGIDYLRDQMIQWLITVERVVQEIEP